MAHRVLEHSEPAVPDDALPRDDTDRSQLIRVRLVLRPADDAELSEREAADRRRLEARLADARSAPLGTAQPLTPAELSDLRRPHADALAAVHELAREGGLRVTESRPSLGDIQLEGTISDFERIFAVRIDAFDQGGETRRAHAGPLSLPEALHSHVIGVVGLSDLEVARRGAPSTEPQNADTPDAGSTAPTVGNEPLQVHRPERFEEYYRLDALPSATARQRIVLFEMGGGFHQDDVARFVTTLGDGDVPVPTVRSVMGAGNRPLGTAELAAFVHAKNDEDMPVAEIEDFLAGSNTFEVTMDVELIAAFAPGADIEVCFCPLSPGGLYEAIAAVVHDLDTADDPPMTTMALSWGWSEDALDPRDVDCLESILTEVARRGITFCASSGDHGSANDVGGRLATVNYPASSPSVMGVGGTQIECTDGTFGAEETWNTPSWHGTGWGSGGGMSGYFEVPAHQVGIGTPTAATIRAADGAEPFIAGRHRHVADFAGRGVPDVAANAGMPTGYLVIAGGASTAGIGTSAATPLWAAVVARLQRAVAARFGTEHQLGFLPDRLHRLATMSAPGSTGRSAAVPGLKDITAGDNRMPWNTSVYFTAGPGWDACTGWGAPLGDELLEVLIEHG